MFSLKIRLLYSSGQWAFASNLIIIVSESMRPACTSVATTDVIANNHSNCSSALELCGPRVIKEANLFGALSIQ